MEHSPAILNPCPLHPTVDSFVFTVKNNFTIRKCPSCKLMFVSPAPIHADEIYSADYFQGAVHGFGYTDYDNDKEAMRATFVKYLECIENLIDRPGRLLDVGAATGFFLSIAKERGWEVAGIELSEFAALQGQKKGFDIRPGTLSNCGFLPESFDVITLWDVIEHVIDPAVELAEVRKLLKPGGVVAINTPDAGSLLARMLGKQWHALVPPEHLYYFNVQNFKELLNTVQFETVFDGAFTKKFTVSYIYKTLIHWQPWLSWSWLGKFLERPAMRRISIPLYLHDNFFLVAKKPKI